MPDSEELHRAYGFSVAHAILFLFTVPTAMVLLIYGLAIYVALGVITADATAPIVMAGLLVAIFALYRTGPGQARSLPLLKGLTKYEPYGEYSAFFPPVHKRQICDFCGMEFGGEKCTICGRNMCDTCWVKTQPYQRCPECLHCPICGSGVSDYPCMICGKQVCRECIVDGVCIECAAHRAPRTRWTRGKPREGPTQRERVILEPLRPISNAILKEVTPKSKKALMDGPPLRLGDDVEVLDAPFRVIAASPVGAQSISISDTTTVNLVNREERDGKLAGIRTQTGYPVCHAQGCNYLIGRRCVSCSNFTCPNHSDLCTACRKIVCHECVEEGLCKFCATLARTGERPRLTVREALGILARSYFLLPVTMIFYAVFYYGEPLESINPSLRPILAFGILVAGPAIAFTYALARALRRRSPAPSEAAEG